MTVKLDIHPASEEERVQTFRNVHDIWSGGLGIAEHVQRRLNSVQHSRAQWFVGCLDGQVVTSLGTYPLQFILRGESKPGFAIGAVHTLPEFRGVGLAPQLIDYVENYQSSQGATISLLYSDIKPEYYARLGYHLCPATEGWKEIELPEESLLSEENSEATNGHPKLICFSPTAAIESLSRLYDEYHQQLPIFIARDHDYWSHLIRKFPDDLFYLLNDLGNQNLGFIRLVQMGTTLKIRDYALANRSSELEDLLFRAVLQLTKQLGAEKIGSWLPATTVTQKSFSLQNRSTEITMLKSLSSDVTFDMETLNAAEHFHEIDHV